MILIFIKLRQSARKLKAARSNDPEPATPSRRSKTADTADSVQKSKTVESSDSVQKSKTAKRAMGPPANSPQPKKKKKSNGRHYLVFHAVDFLCQIHIWRRKS